MTCGDYRVLPPLHAGWGASGARHSPRLSRADRPSTTRARGRENATMSSAEVGISPIAAFPMVTKPIMVPR